jgi:hypothetical protein
MFNNVIRYNLWFFRFLRGFFSQYDYYLQAIISQYHKLIQTYKKIRSGFNGMPLNIPLTGGDP